MGGFHIGDMLVQLLFLLIIALVIIVLVKLFLSSRKRKHQLDRLEEKVDTLESKMNK
ncbi:hypothetical protein [Ornithinibacillus sp. 179-J 7C1 HS]|uniref:hypothetical protein n=1 Tax=Ornithinibacillus sp. 179-J 7C1 HS TaxID=3142384 RepID=UPI0039A032B9